MVRRLIFGALIGFALLAGTAVAQDSPSPTTTTTTTTTTTVTPTTAAVLPTTIINTTTETVKGVVIARPLPRTGSDFGPQVVVGAGLTAAGLAFAISARLRRQRVNAHVHS